MVALTDAVTRPRSLATTTSRLLASLAFLAAIGFAPGAAVEVPLTRASFERALQEGRSCKRPKSTGPYLVVKKGTEPFLAAVLGDLIEEFGDVKVSDSYVKVLLTTPYTRVKRAACLTALFGAPFDEAALWETARTSSTVTLQVETWTSTTITKPDAAENVEKYGVSAPTTVRESGPGVIGAALRRGEDRNAPLIQPVSEVALEYEFPASALQGEGPFYLVIGIDTPDKQVTVKLKKSVLEKP